MIDEILKLRLEMLSDSLRTAVNITAYLTRDVEALGIDTTALQQAFDYHTQQQETKIKKTRDLVDKTDVSDQATIQLAWSEYTELRERNARIYREFLEAMSGLAIRRNQIDESFCKIADALILSMKSYVVRADALAIPASQEAHSRTLARLVRMPEWTIWSVPLVAHEFGHVVIDDVPELATFAEAEAHAEVEADAGYLQHPKDEAEKRNNDAIRRWASCRVRQLMADAFAVNTTGPSYA
jgi:hypothetical protein